MVEQGLADWLEEGYVSSFRTACLILGNRADAEEAVQDAYLRAWRFRDSLAAVPSIRPWLYRVVVNACYSKLRREIPHRDRRAGDAALADVAARDADPDTRAEQTEVAETVLAALQRLPVSLRVPVVLRYYADLSERDIALAIGRRPGTVKSRLHEARRRLAADPTLSALAGTGAAPDAAHGETADSGGSAAFAESEASEMSEVSEASEEVLS
ncbi:MAG TPA: RNA polymerase sigma factor [Acidimicrobiales bacterium]|nr:RNA polymerase sigma factor [Acidimicrobiales bacterium]